MSSAGALTDAYGDASANAREAMVTLSPLVTEAYALLNRPGQNPSYGPIPALTALANDLRTERDDVAWRVDYLHSTDAQPLGLTGRVRAFIPADLNAAFRQAGLTPEEIEAAEDMMRDGVSLDHATEAAKSRDPEATLDRLRLAELNDEIENWSGSDNDPILDAMLREARDIQERMDERQQEVDDLWAAFRRQEAEAWSTPERTPFEDAEHALDQIRDILDTAKQDRGDGIGSADADGVWSTNDLNAMIENEHGYYTDEQVEYARIVLAMAESSEDARDHLGISQSGGGWSFSDIGHLTLDVFGMVPVVGNAADGINAAWYLAEGEYLDAALSSIALLPGIGQAATLAKPAIKAAADGLIFRNLDEALQWAKRWLEDAGILGRSGDNVVNATTDVLRSNGDPMRAVQGPGRGTPEFSQLVEELRSQGFDVVTNRPGSLAYSPAQGQPGRIILDPDASMSALRHEAQHALDDAANGFPGMGYYSQNPDARWAMEQRAYDLEIEAAHAAGRADIAEELVANKDAEFRAIYFLD